jgi:hypothetical protein
MAGARRGPGKVVDIGDLLGQGRARVGGGDQPADELSDAAQALDERPASDKAAERSRTEEPATQPPSDVPPQRPPATTAQDRTPSVSAPPEPDLAVTRLEPLYTRVPEYLKARLDEASHALRRMKASNQEIVAALLDQEVDPSTPAGLAALTRRLERYRRAKPGR